MSSAAVEGREGGGGEVGREWVGTGRVLFKPLLPVLCGESACGLRLRVLPT